MDEISLKPINIETMEQISYDRSKIWANLMDKFSKSEDSLDIHLNNIETLYADEDEDDDAAMSANEAEESTGESDEILHDITNNASEHYGTSKQNSLSISGIPVNVEENKVSACEASDEIQDILNQTKPLLVEHERRWREAGIDRILNTFDAKKIEKEVGSWISRNNSFAPGNTIPVRCNNLDGLYQRHANSESDNESLHSVDTARYILSSRKAHSSHRMSSAHKGMSIKKYRLVPSMRDNLREKYGCINYDDEAHIIKVRCRRTPKQYHHCEQKESIKFDEIGLSSKSLKIKHRQKVLRKRRMTYKDYTPTSVFSSSDDEYIVTNHLNDVHRIVSMSSRSPLLRQHNRKSRTLRSCKSAHYDHSLSSSNSSEYSLNCESVPHKVKLLRAYSKPDKRPFKREAECSCCNAGSLCDDVRHFTTDTSSEWLVENCKTPLKSRQGSKHDHKGSMAIGTFSTPKVLEDFLPIRRHGTQESDKPSKLCIKNNQKKEVSSAINDQVKKDTSDNKVKKTKSKENVDHLGKVKEKTVSQKSKENANKLKDPKKKQKLTLTMQKIDEENSDEALGKEEKTIRKANRSELNSNGPEVEIKKKCPRTSITNYTKSLDLCQNNLKESTKLENSVYKTQLTQNSTQNSTFFKGTKHLCNSTAVLNDVAIKRQFSKSKESVADVMSIISSENSVVGDNRTDANGLKKGRVKLPINDVLLYTPQNKALAPADCVKNGFFHITEEHLSTMIGEELARKFTKYYIGCRKFNCNSTVYYRPPKTVEFHSKSDTESDDDVFVSLYKYGDLYQVNENK